MTARGTALAEVLPCTACQCLEARGRPVSPISNSSGIGTSEQLNCHEKYKPQVRGVDACLCRVRLKQQALAHSSLAVAAKDDSASECGVYSFAPEQSNSPPHAAQMPVKVRASNTDFPRPCPGQYCCTLSLVAVLSDGVRWGHVLQGSADSGKTLAGSIWWKGLTPLFPAILPTLTISPAPTATLSPIHWVVSQRFWVLIQLSSYHIGSHLVRVVTLQLYSHSQRPGPLPAPDALVTTFGT